MNQNEDCVVETKQQTNAHFHCSSDVFTCCHLLMRAEMRRKRVLSFITSILGPRRSRYSVCCRMFSAQVFRQSSLLSSDTVRHVAVMCFFFPAQVHVSRLPVHPLLVTLHLLCGGDNDGEHRTAASLGKKLESFDQKWSAQRERP